MDASSGITLFCLAAGSSWLLTFVCRWAAPKLGVMDRPGGRKKHLHATPLLGGLAVYLGCLIALAAASVLLPAERSNFTVGLAVCGGLFCLIGLIDDKGNLRARDKFLLQIAASIPFAMWTQSISSIHILGVDLPLGWLGIAFTVFWLVACTNVVNLLDGIDGLATTIGAIICFAVCTLSLMNGKTETAIASVALAGALLGFFGHNCPPARIFLGDAGSLTIGFMAGALAIEGSTKKATGFMLGAPLIVMSIPAFDAFLAIVRRKLNGRGIGVADRGHIHHRLLDRGLTGPQTLLAIASVSLVMAVAAVAAIYYQSDALGLGICAAMIGLLVAAKVCGGHETELFFQHLRLAGGVLADASGLFRARMVMTRLEMGVESERESFWDAVCQAAESTGADELVFRIQSDSGVSHRRWKAENAHEANSIWQTDYVAKRQSGEASILIRGADNNSHLTGMDELLGMAALLCKTWPLDGSAALESRAEEILEFPAAATQVAEADTQSEAGKRRAA